MSTALLSNGEGTGDGEREGRERERGTPFGRETMENDLPKASHLHRSKVNTQVGGSAILMGMRRRGEGRLGGMGSGKLE